LATKATEFGKITQNKIYAVQSYSRSKSYSLAETSVHGEVPTNTTAYGSGLASSSTEQSSPNFQLQHKFWYNSNNIRIGKSWLL